MGEDILNGPSGPEAVEALIDELVEAVSAVYEASPGQRMIQGFILSNKSYLQTLRVRG